MTFVTYQRYILTPRNGMLMTRRWSSWYKTLTEMTFSKCRPKSLIDREYNVNVGNIKLMEDNTMISWKKNTVRMSTVQNMSGFWMVRFQIPTVVAWLLNYSDFKKCPKFRHFAWNSDGKRSKTGLLKCSAFEFCPKSASCSSQILRVYYS